MKVVINQRYGGFGLSQKALIELKNQGWTVSLFNDQHSPIDREADLLFKPKGSEFGHVGEDRYVVNWWKHKEGSNGFRTRKDVIAIVEQLGEEADGEHASLEIINADDAYYWEISDYDGFEKIQYGSLKDDDGDDW